MKRINTKQIVESINEPPNTNCLWLKDGKVHTFNNGKWELYSDVVENPEKPIELQNGMKCIFWDEEAINKVDWKNNECTDFRDMFAFINIDTLDLSELDTRNIKIANTFSSVVISTLNISNWVFNLDINPDSNIASMITHNNPEDGKRCKLIARNIKGIGGRYNGSIYYGSWLKDTEFDYIDFDGVDFLNCAIAEGFFPNTLVDLVGNFKNFGLSRSLRFKDCASLSALSVLNLINGVSSNVTTLTFNIAVEDRLTSEIIATATEKGITIMFRNDSDIPV